MGVMKGLFDDRRFISMEPYHQIEVLEMIKVRAMTEIYKRPKRTIPSKRRFTPRNIMQASRYDSAPELVLFTHIQLKNFDKSKLEADVSELIDEINFEVSVLLRRYKNRKSNVNYNSFAPKRSDDSQILLRCKSQESVGRKSRIISPQQQRATMFSPPPV